jgi:NTE family protein
MSRALVLGSGGLTGIAWEAGVLQGLAEAGYPTVPWDCVIGSSAGAFVGARLLAAGSPEEMYQAQLTTRVAVEESALEVATGGLLIRLLRLSRRMSSDRFERVAVLPLILRAVLVNAARDGLGEFSAVAQAVRSRKPGVPPATAVAAMARLARGVATPERAWIDYWARALLPVVDWPAGRLVMTAVDVGDASTRRIDKAAGVPIARAMAATSAVAGLLPPISIGERRYIDGGTGSATNADLALGFDDVLVVAPTDRGALAGELELLRASGSSIRVIRPSSPAGAALGQEVGRLDPARRPAAARAGRLDGLAAVASWTATGVSVTPDRHERSSHPSDLAPAHRSPGPRARRAHPGPDAP